MAIIVTYWEGDESRAAPFTKLTYAEWEKDGRSYYGHANEDSFNGGDETDEDELPANKYGHIEVRGIPNEVREALAYLIAPHLRPAA